MSATVTYGPGVSGVLDFLISGPTAIDINIQPSPAATSQEIIRRYDPFLHVVSQNMVSMWGKYGVLQFPDRDQPGILSLGTKVDRSLPKLARNDETYYATSLHGISSLLSVLGTGRCPILPDHSRERFCRHATFVGSGVYPKIGGLSEPPSHRESLHALQWNDPIPSVLKRNNASNVWAFYPDRSPFLYEWDEFQFSYADFITELSKLPSIDAGGGTQFHSVHSTISGLMNSGSVLRFSTQTHLSLGGPYFMYDPVEYWWSFDFEFSIDEALRQSYLRLDIPSGWWGLLTRYQPKLVFKSFTCSRSYDCTLQPAFPTPYWTYTDIFRKAPVWLPAGSVAVPDQKSWWSVLKSFRTSINDNWSDIVPSALFSVVSAVGNVEQGTSTDVLQTLQHLPEYESMIPKIREALHILGEISHRDVSLLTAKEILDLLSTTILQGNFQWRPLLQLLTVEIPKMVGSLSALRNKSGVVAGRGKWEFNFPSNSFNRPVSHLVTRSKIVLDVSGRPLVWSLLGFDALGLLPKASNLWDLLPFTFVVNWFTGVGQSIRRAEYASFLLTIPAYYIHTYTITSPFTEQELTNWSMVSSGSDPLSMKVFYRDISLYTPLPHDSRFGFGIPTNLPPIGTIGALLYQILF